jgi:RNA polymerase sigma-70 factor (ECF subfamily)
MEPKNRYDGLPARVVRNVQFKAKQLARRRAIPGMDADDIEQDLMLDLLQRRDRYDPSRASFETFAEHVINHRIATLTLPTSRLRAERTMISLDAPVGCDDEQGAFSLGDLTSTRAGLYADEDVEPEASFGLRRDVVRFRETLSPDLRRYADILGDVNVSAAARVAGVHRSTIYVRIAEMRSAAIAAGLHQYLEHDPTLRNACR